MKQTALVCKNQEPEVACEDCQKGNCNKDVYEDGLCYMCWQDRNKPSNRVFSFPIKTFNPEKLLDEMLNADEGTVFVLGEKTIKHTEGDNSTEMTFVQIKKVRSN